MHVNGIKSFKIDSVDPTTTSPSSDPVADEVSSDLDDVFGDGTSGTTGSGSDWVITDPTAPTGEEATMGRLTDYPPGLDYILAQNEQAVRYLDVIKERYISTKEGLIALRENYRNALYDVTTSEAALLQQKIELVNAAIMKCDQEIENCTNKMEGDSRIYDQEKSTGKDLNGDGWIGRPGADGSLRVIYHEGTPYYLDAQGNRVQNPFLDPDYEASVLNNDSFTALDPEASDPAMQPIGYGSENAENADLYFKLNELRDSYDEEGNKFNTPINIGVPEYLWVPKEDDSWEPKLSEDDNSYEFEPDLWEGGIQRVPEDKTDYVQVRVAEVKVWSEEVQGITASDGTKLWNTIVEFKDSEGTIIASMRIEGRFADGPASTITTSGNYIAASSVGIGFFGANRASPIRFDASEYKSTGRHIVDDMADALDITGNDHASFEENMAAFEGASFTTTYTAVAGTGTSSTPTPTDVEHDFDYGTGHERYTSELPGATDMLQSFRSGVFVTGLRGEFTGSQFNDVFDIPDVNFTNDYIDEHTPEDAEKIKPEDPLYASVVDGGGGGNDFVRAGKGSLYAKNVTFAWVEACHDDSVMIKVRQQTYTNLEENSDADAEDTINNDPKNFVYVHGSGTTGLFDEGEGHTSQNEGFKAGYEGDDYYELSGEIMVSDPANHDVVGWEELSDGNQAGEFSGEWAEIETEIIAPLNDAITGFGIEEDPEFDATTEWSNEYGFAAEQDAEMDTFFNDMFGDMNEFEVEMTEMSGGTI